VPRRLDRVAPYAWTVVHPAQGGSEFAVDDPIRPRIRRAVVASVAAAVVFFGFTLTKQVKPLYAHAPWLNDPYDAVISFAMFFVPVITAVTLVRVVLCRRGDVLDKGRVASIVRGCQLAVAVILFEIASAWSAVGLKANAAHWSTTSSSVLLALLGATTGAALVALMLLAPIWRTAQFKGTVATSDLIADAVASSELLSERLGPLGRRVRACLRLADRTVGVFVRRHPVVSAVFASAGFGAVVLGWQGFRERYDASATILAMGLGFCGMFAFLMCMGAYLSVVGSPHPLRGVPRRAVDALVASCAAVIVALAFRNSMWGLVGSDVGHAGTTQFAQLVALAAAVIFAVTFLVENCLGSWADHTMSPVHSGPPT
jgi:hypothetical protein